MYVPIQHLKPILYAVVTIGVGSSGDGGIPQPKNFSQWGHGGKMDLAQTHRVYIRLLTSKGVSTMALRIAHILTLGIYIHCIVLVH